MERAKLYNEIGTNYRYFLDWRHKLLAGFLVSIAGLAIAFSWAYTINDLRPYTWLILLLGTIITLVFWGLDVRNRDLYHACQKAGAKIEKDENKDTCGIYTYFEAMEVPLITHSFVLNRMYIITIILFITGMLILLL